MRALIAAALCAAISAAPGSSWASSKARVSSLPPRVVVAPVLSISAPPFVNSLGTVPNELTKFQIAGAAVPAAAGSVLPLSRPIQRGVAAVAKGEAAQVALTPLARLQGGVAALEHARGREELALGRLFGETVRRDESVLAGPYGSFGLSGARLQSAAGPVEAPDAPVPPAPKPRARAVVVGAGLSVAAILAAGPWLYAEPWLAGALGTAALSVIGFPQILKNFRERAAATKDVAFGWPVLWLAAA